MHVSECKNVHANSRAASWVPCCRCRSHHSGHATACTPRQATHAQAARRTHHSHTGSLRWQEEHAVEMKGGVEGGGVRGYTLPSGDTGPCTAPPSPSPTSRPSHPAVDVGGVCAVAGGGKAAGQSAVTSPSSGGGGGNGVSAAVSSPPSAPASTLAFAPPAPPALPALPVLPAVVVAIRSVVPAASSAACTRAWFGWWQCGGVGGRGMLCSSSCNASTGGADDVNCCWCWIEQASALGGDSAAREARGDPRGDPRGEEAKVPRGEPGAPEGGGGGVVVKNFAGRRRGDLAAGGVDGGVTGGVGSKRARRVPGDAASCKMGRGTVVVGSVLPSPSRPPLVCVSMGRTGRSSPLGSATAPATTARVVCNVFRRTRTPVSSSLV
jgi:hypothetical protein